MSCVLIKHGPLPGGPFVVTTMHKDGEHIDEADPLILARTTRYCISKPDGVADDCASAVVGSVDDATAALIKADLEGVGWTEVV